MLARLDPSPGSLLIARIEKAATQAADWDLETTRPEEFTRAGRVRRIARDKIEHPCTFP
jgi:hypothetical protein